jgi:hypothetical protein
MSPLVSIVETKQKKQEQKTSLNLSLAMKTFKSTSIVCLHGILAVALMTAASRLHATTIWNGPTITFVHSNTNGNPGDQWTTGVIITRKNLTGKSGGLYNAVTETGATVGISPKDTKWAIGALSNYNKLTYGACPLDANNPASNIGTTFVVHMTNEDIYLSLKLTSWGGQGGLGDKFFSYIRSTPSPTPTISITNPVSGAVFTAPANVTIQVDAEVSSGTVTNVQFFTNGISAGSVLAAPFNLTVNNLAAGPYALKAVATAAGVTATSSVVNITVNSPVSPPSVSITNPVSGAVFAAPANISLEADASVSGGTVTNVEFFANGSSQGAVTVAPFTLISSPLAAGPYALTAVATASGISATSAVVNVSVVNPMPVNLSGAMVSSGQFIFSYTADAGLTYVVQSSSNLVDWLSLMTNVASGNPMPFTNALNPSGPGFYRVERLPNP